MELLISILFFIANFSSYLFVPLILAVVSLFISRRSSANAIRQARSEQRTVSAFQSIGHKFVWLCLLIACGMLLFVTANLFLPHFADAASVYRMGKFADEKIINTQTFSEVNDPELTVRYDLMYKTEAGEIIETYFYSSDHNFYPPARSVNFAQPGESFRIAYLSSFPKVFVVVTDGEAPYRKRATCAELAPELNKARGRRDLDPENQQYAAQLAEIRKRFAEAGCS